MYSNPRGIRSKKESINSITEDTKPDIIIFAETNLKGKNTMKIKGFKEAAYRNPKQKVGGLLIATNEKSKIEMIILDIHEKYEHLWAKITINKQSFVIGAVYGIANETTTNKEEIEEWHEELEETYIKYANEKVIIIGDFNAHIGDDEEGIEGNLKKKNKNGKLLREFIKRQNLTIINKHQKCTGKWTREDPKGTRSIIDFVISNWEMNEIISSMKIDDEHQYKITRYQKKKGKPVATPSDHNTIFVEIEEEAKTQKIKEKRWNYKNEEGLERYRKATENIKMAENWEPGDDINKKYKKWMKQIKTVMYQTIQRITVQTRSKTSQIKNLIKRKQQGIRELIQLKKKGITKGTVVNIIQKHVDTMVTQIIEKTEEQKIIKLQNRIQNATKKAP